MLFFQEALAKHQVPGPHDKFVHTPLNAKKLTPHLISERPSEDQVLSRCVSGKTQNANGCLHSLIWTRFAKDSFASRKRVHSAHVTGAGQFNSGASATQERGCFDLVCLFVVVVVFWVGGGGGGGGFETGQGYISQLHEPSQPHRVISGLALSPVNHIVISERLRVQSTTQGYISASFEPSQPHGYIRASFVRSQPHRVS